MNVRRVLCMRGEGEAVRGARSAASAHKKNAPTLRDTHRRFEKLTLLPVRTCLPSYSPRFRRPIVPRALAKVRTVNVDGAHAARTARENEVAIATTRDQFLVLQCDFYFLFL
jgi:hypothetical protein